MTSIVAAIDYAADTLNDNSSNNDIRILNCSFGLYDSPYNRLMPEAIERYGELGGLVVCSAGNDNKNTDGAWHYPSHYSCDHDYVISVGASTSNDQKWNYSNYGAYTVDIFAPGEGILSCYPAEICNTMGLDCSETHFSTGYHYNNGTSMAAPHVSGVAALMLAEKPNLTASEIKTIINNNADDSTPFTNKCVSDGRLNAYKAVLACHTHSYSYAITATTHAGSCRCGATTAAAAHTYITDSNGTYYCRVCGYGRIGQIESIPGGETE